MTDHPITPPPELVEEWICESDNPGEDVCVGSFTAAKWGADQELQAVLVWLRVKGFDKLASDLLVARRPKPPSLKKQAQQSLLRLASHSNNLMSEDAADMETIRRALEALPE